MKLVNPTRSSLCIWVILTIVIFLNLKVPQDSKAVVVESKDIESRQFSKFPPIRKNTDTLKPKTRGKELYNENQFQSFHLKFSHEDYDWFPQLHDYFQTGLTIPARLTVGNEDFHEVRVRFKGASSYYFTPFTKKKSFDITLNQTFKKQRLFGYKKFNLNNGYLDPTMVREVIYLGICSHYVPTGRTNLVQLTINDDLWGVYTNVQQINSEFFKEWFPDSDGNRWRGILSRDGYWRVDAKTYNIAQPFTWQGPQEENYYGFYKLRSTKKPETWNDLIKVCRRLTMSPLDRLEDRFDSVFAVDNALWLIALENVFMDNDSFLRKGYDYFIFQEPEYKLLYLIQHDGNEAFGTGTPRQWPEGVTSNLEPFFQTNNPNSPLVGRLLSIPTFRQRYLAHMRTIIDEWLDWEIIGPKVDRLQALVESTMIESKTTFYPLEQFRKNVLEDCFFEFRPTGETMRVPGLKSFIEGRRDFLLNHPDISRSPPEIESVTLVNDNIDQYTLYSNQVALIQVKIGDSVDVTEVLLHFTHEPTAPFQHVVMFDDGNHSDGSSGDGIFTAEISPRPAGSEICFYVEARAADEVLTTVFSPPRAEREFYSYKVRAPSADSTQIVINEVLSANRTGIRDPKGNRNDWIELLNVSHVPVNLSDCYLSDDESNPRKWVFPKGTSVPPGRRLLVWADGDQKSDPGLHTNFKLSRTGETLLLVDSDSNWNFILDRVEIDKLEVDVAFGRSPDGVGEFQNMKPTPGKVNQ